MTNGYHVGHVLREMRLKLGLSEEYCANISGLDSSCYYDVETSEDEFFNNISLGAARRLCRVIKANIIEIINCSGRFGLIHKVDCSDLNFYMRNNIIKQARVRKKMSVKELADRAQVEEYVVRDAEWSADFIESITIEMVVQISCSLDLNPGDIICNQ